MTRRAYVRSSVRGGALRLRDPHQGLGETRVHVRGLGTSEFQVKATDASWCPTAGLGLRMLAVAVSRAIVQPGSRSDRVGRALIRDACASVGRPPCLLRSRGRSAIAQMQQSGSQNLVPVCETDPAPWHRIALGGLFLAVSMAMFTPLVKAADVPGTTSVPTPEIVVTAPRGSASGGIEPLLELSPSELDAYGADSLRDLVNALRPLTRSSRSDQMAVVLINGHLAGQTEFENLPREAIERVDLGGQSVEDFARARAITPNNASVRLHRARKAVARDLTTVCGTCAEHKCFNCTCKRSQV